MDTAFAAMLVVTKTLFANELFDTDRHLSAGANFRIEPKFFLDLPDMDSVNFKLSFGC